ncbi:MAG: hypothetical protein ACFCVK_15295 [Acidimicrobiales bacterium]
MRPAHTVAMLNRTVELVSLDVFGVALEPVVLRHRDIHHLVASSLAATHPKLRPTYVELRLEAERRVRRTAGEAGRGEIAVSEIADHLAFLLDRRMPLTERDRTARGAMQLELGFERLAWRPNPWALRLHRRARERGMGVAFVADSALPRDLVSKMLAQAGFDHDFLLMSSQEGTTKASGRLYHTLIQRTGVWPESILHIGPDDDIDGQRATAAGLRAHVVPRPRRHEDPALGPDVAGRSGVDSFGLALVAERLDRCRGAMEPDDLGYYAGGPLAAGLVALAGSMLARNEVDRVVLCGAAGPCLHRAATLLAADGDQRMHPLTIDDDDRASAARFDELVERHGIGHDERLLAVDLGWRDPSHERLRALVAGVGRSNPVRGAYLGLPGEPADETDDVTVLLPGPIPTPGGDPGVLESLLPSPHDRRGHRPPAGGSYDAAREGIASGVEAFARDFGPWLHLDRSGTTPALVGPALRVASRPTYDEAALLGQYPSAVGAGPEGRTIPLAVLPPLATSLRNPLLVGEVHPPAIWAEGYEALVGGVPEGGPARLARRLIARRRRNGRRHPDSA